METEIQEQQPQTEKWRTIPEFPNYVISNKGRVANKNGKMLSGKVVKLSRDGWQTKRVVLRIMAQVWPKA